MRIKKILTILFCSFILLSLTGCSNEKVTTKDDFTSILAERGFYINDITDDVDDSNVMTVLTANNKKYQFEYYIFKSEKLAENAYKNNKKLFEEAKEPSKEQNKKDYKKYIQETNDYYNVLVQHKKIFIFYSNNIEYKKDFNKTLKALGY